MRLTQKRSQELQAQAKVLYSKGLKNTEIANTLDVQPKTIANWLKHFKTEFKEMAKTKPLLIKRINEALSNPKTTTSEIKDLFTSLSLYKKAEIS